DDPDAVAAGDQQVRQPADHESGDEPHDDDGNRNTHDESRSLRCRSSATHMTRDNPSAWNASGASGPGDAFPAGARAGASSPRYLPGAALNTACSGAAEAPLSHE